MSLMAPPTAPPNDPPKDYSHGEWNPGEEPNKPKPGGSLTRVLIVILLALIGFAILFLGMR